MSDFYKDSAAPAPNEILIKNSSNVSRQSREIRWGKIQPHLNPMDHFPLSPMFTLLSVCVCVMGD
jgi:hypothetical protein